MVMVCPHCKKQFTVYRGLLVDYVYKFAGYYYCSYSCWRYNGGDNGYSSRPKHIKNVIITKKD